MRNNAKQLSLEKEISSIESLLDKKNNWSEMRPKNLEEEKAAKL